LISQICGITILLLVAIFGIIPAWFFLGLYRKNLKTGKPNLLSFWFGTLRDNPLELRLFYSFLRRQCLSSPLCLCYDCLPVYILQRFAVNMRLQYNRWEPLARLPLWWKYLLFSVWPLKLSCHGWYLRMCGFRL
jgi:hypothetical protein